MLAHLAALWVVFFVFATIFRKDDPAALRSGSTLAGEAEPTLALERAPLTDNGPAQS
jgi:hypothetical protein